MLCFPSPTPWEREGPDAQRREGEGVLAHNPRLRPLAKKAGDSGALRDKDRLRDFLARSFA